MRRILTLGSVMVLGLGAAACGSDDGDDAAADVADAAERPTVVVTTNILGDVVSQVVGDLAAVEVIMPLGADPHDFAPSVRQAAAMEDAHLLVVNGANFEEGMLGVIDSVADGGTPVFAFADAVELLEGDAHDDEEHADEEHADETHTDEDHTDEEHADEEHADEEHTDETHTDEEHSHEGGTDPHLWTDPARMIDGVRGLGAALGVLDGVDATALQTQVDAYVAELEAVDAEIEAALAVVPDEQRVLVTNHEVFAYFADRYGFEVVGAVVPSLTTSAETSTRELEQLAELIEAEGIPAIFAETTQSSELAEALAGEVGGEVVIVELFTESLGEPGSGAETYIDLMRTNAELIVDALAGA